MPTFHANGGNEMGSSDNGIYKAVLKEMAMANSSYARAAGIQSEISKVTVTRVASSEVECKRQTNVYKKDMIITINNISREQRMLRKAMVRYSKKRKQNKVIKEKREREILEREQREREEVQKWEQIHALLNMENDVTNGQSKQNSDEMEEDEADKLIISDENNNETYESKTKRTKNTKNDQNSDESEYNLNHFDVLPSITEAENEHEQNIDSEQSENKALEEKSISSEIKPPSEEISSSSLSPLFAVTLRPLKPKKQIVSFSDIIKLKHSHNTNKLFDMVHTLAQKHGVNESVEKRRQERRNSRIPRGSTDAVISESLRKAASVIYPMRFGYGDHESNNNEKFDFYGDDSSVIPEKSEVSNEQRKSETVSLNSQSSKKIKRHKTITNFNEEMKRLKKEDKIKSGIDDKGRRYSNISNRSSSSKVLPPISSGRSSPSRTVSWAEAFGLLKIVHSID